MWTSPYRKQIQWNVAQIICCSYRCQALSDIQVSQTNLFKEVINVLCLKSEVKHEVSFEDWCAQPLISIHGKKISSYITSVI